MTLNRNKEKEEGKEEEVEEVKEVEKEEGCFIAERSVRKRSRTGACGNQRIA
jgi:hypothetical protein